MTIFINFLDRFVMVECFFKAVKLTEFHHLSASTGELPLYADTFVSVYLKFCFVL